MKISKGFGERMAGDGTVTSPQCHSCKHYYKGTLTCAAYPDEIPIDIRAGRVDHKKPVAGDDGIHWEAKPN